MCTGSFPGVKCGRGVLLTTHPLLVPRSWKSRAIPLPTLWATPGLKQDHFTFISYLFITQRRLLIIRFQSVVHRASSEVNSWLAGQEIPFIWYVMSVWFLVTSIMEASYYRKMLVPVYCVTWHHILRIVMLFSLHWEPQISQQILCILIYLQVSYCVHMSAPLVHILV